MTSAVTKRQLGRTGIEITPIGIGTMQMANKGVVTAVYKSLTEDTSAGVVRAAIEGGVNWFDTAEMYGGGESERTLTTALRTAGANPGDVLIATKWAPFGRSAASIRNTIDKRLSALQGFPIDLHQIHLPFGSFSSIPAQVRAMAELVKAGKIRSVGVSNFSAAQMEQASAVLKTYGLELASNQVRISALHRNIEKNGVLDAAKRLGVTLIAYSPLESGILTGRFHDDPNAYRSLPRVRQMSLGSAKKIEQATTLIDELRAIGKEHDASISQLALAWLINYHGDTVVAIPGASKPHQAEQSAAAMTVELDQAELATIAEASRRSGGL